MSATPGGGVPTRVLIVSVDIGESHSVMARALRADLERHGEGIEVSVVEDFRMLGPLLTRVLYRRAHFHVVRLRWSYHLAYRVFMHLRPLRSLGEWLLYLFGRRSVAELVEARRPDLILSTHPFMSVVLARMRLAGRLDTPVGVVVGPIRGLGYWTQPGADHHLVHYQQAVPEVSRLARRSRVHAVRPLVDEAFFHPVSAEDARRRLGLRGSPLILICGGGWGVGDLAGTVSVALERPECGVVVIAGRNDAVRRSLEERFAGQPRVRVLGFTNEMSELLAAADVFVTSSVGVSCFEARLRGCPVVCYGYPLAHVRDNMAGLEHHGLARSAYTLDGLRRAIDASLAAPRRPERELAELPRASHLVLAAVARPPAARAAAR